MQCIHMYVLEAFSEKAEHTSFSNYKSLNLLYRPKIKCVFRIADWLYNGCEENWL